MPPPSSLRRTLLHWLLFPLLTLLVISAVAAYGIALGFAQEAFDRALFESAYDISQLVKKSAEDGQPPFHLPRAAKALILSDKYDEIYYNIRDERGDLLSGESALAPPPIAPERSEEGQFYDAEIKGKSLRVASLVFRLATAGGERRIHIQVAETLHKRELLARRILTGLILPQLLLILLAAGIVWYAVGRGLEPLTKLEASVAARSHLDLSPVQAPDAPAEAQPLVAAINALLSRMERVLEAQKRFIADAAHQMRTPLAGLKAQITLASRQKTLEDARHSLNQLGTTADRLTHLVNQLLSVARNEPGADRSLQMEPLDLNALAQHATDEWLSTAFRSEIDLGYEGPNRPVWIKGDALRLAELLKNLLDNALRYTPKGSIVTVRVLSSGRIEVEDNGPGIPAAEAEQVFERFYRVLGSEADGSGLGLAIVKEIAQVHGAQVAVRPGADGHGARFQVDLPLLASSAPA